MDVSYWGERLILRCDYMLDATECFLISVDTGIYVEGESSGHLLEPQFLRRKKKKMEHWTLCVFQLLATLQELVLISPHMNIFSWVFHIE